MLRLVRRLLGLRKADRASTPEQKLEVLKRLQVNCVHTLLQHESRTSLTRIRK